MGAARDAALGAARSAHSLGLHLRRHLPGPRERRWPRPATLQYRRDGAASGGNLANRDTGRPCRSAARPGRLAPLRQARYPRQHHPDAAAAQIARTQPGRKYLAVHARQLALQPRLRLPRALLLRLERARRPALDHHVNRPARLGTSVLISGIWYKSVVLTEEGQREAERLFAQMFAARR